MIWLLACAGRETLVDTERPLDAFSVAGQSFTIVGHHRAWHHGAGFADGLPHGPYDVHYVGYTVTTDAGLVRGDVDHSWELSDRSAADAAYAALAVERCAAGELVAYRVGADPRWRVLVPDAAGGAGGLVPAEGLDCAGALAWAGSAGEWRRNRAAHPAVCVHLQRLRLRDDAIRCLLRRPADLTVPLPRRQDLPGALDDPEFDARLEAILAEGDPTFDPDRVETLRTGRATGGAAAP